MHIVVLGAGAIGTLYGGWLLAGGGDVSFVARGAQLEAMQKSGITLTGADGALSCPKVTAVDRMTELRPADVILVTVKLYDLAEAARIARDNLKNGGLVVGLQNGVDSFDLMREHFAPAQIMVGPAYSAARLIAPGIVEYAGKRNLVTFGNPLGQPHKLAHEFVVLWRKAGVEAEIADDIQSVLWTKFLGFATNAALTCLSRQPAGVVYTDPDLLAVAQQSISEVMAVARAEGVELPDSALADAIRLLQSFPPDMVASMRQDLDAGKRLELDGVCGAINRLGRKHGVATPFHSIAYACLKPYRNGNAARAS